MNISVTSEKFDFAKGGFMLYIMMALLFLVPLCWCICITCKIYHYYFEICYGSYCNIIMVMNNFENKYRHAFDCLFGSIASPKLSKIIIVSSGICSGSVSFEDIYVND